MFHKDLLRRFLASLDPSERLRSKHETTRLEASALFYARRMWSNRVLIARAALAGIVAWLFATSATAGSFSFTGRGSLLLIAIQMGVWGVVGTSLVVLAALDLNKRRDADSLLLFMVVRHARFCRFRQLGN